MKKLTLITTYLLFVNILSAQWIKQIPNYLDTNAALNSIFFIDENNGWTGGYSDDFSDGPSFYSNDAGNTWDGMLIFHSINDIYFSDINNGWAVGDNGQISHTNDGGGNLTSWEEQTITPEFDDDITSMFFVDSLKGWVTSYIENWIAPPSGEIYATLDGGNTWLLQAGTFGLYDIDFLDDSTGWACGVENIIKTVDGGESWESSYIDMVAYSVEVMDENNIWLAGGGYYYPGSIKFSKDGGAAWVTQLADTIPVVNDIEFVSAYNGWAVCDEGKILHTVNGGQTWEYQESGTQADLYSISFVDENNAWICGDSSIILHTNNGGITSIQTLDSKRLTEVEVYPNPVSNNCTIEFFLKQQSHVTIQIFNNLGETIYELENKVFHSCSNKVCWNTGDLKKGIYFCKIQIGKEIITKKIIKAH